MHSLKVPVPPWRQKPKSVTLSPLLEEYLQHRRFNCGVADRTLCRDIKTAKVFLSLLRLHKKTAAKATAADVDAFIIDSSFAPLNWR